MEINFKKVHTGKDLAISSIVLLAGVGLFFASKGLGILIAVCGLLMLLVYKGGYKKEGQDAVLTKKSEDLSRACRSSVIEFLNGKVSAPEIVKGNEGGIIRLEVYYNQAEALAYAQLFNFNNYTYEPATEIVELKGERASKLIEQL